MKIKVVRDHTTRVLSKEEINQLGEDVKQRRRDEIAVCIWAGHDRFYRHLETGKITEMCVPHYATMNDKAIGLFSLIKDRYPEAKLILESGVDNDNMFVTFIYAFNEDGTLSLFESGWKSSIAEAIFNVILQIIEFENSTKGGEILE